MDAMLWIVGAIGSALIGLLVSLFFTEPVKGTLFWTLARLGIRDTQGVAGDWLATFHFPENDEIRLLTEAIRLEERFGMVTGRIIPHPGNHERINEVQREKPIRVRGQLKDNNYITGIWLHPSRRAHYHGSFQLIIHPSGDEMNGSWIGFSRSKNEVLSGKWEWTRIKQSPQLTSSSPSSAPSVLPP